MMMVSLLLSIVAIIQVTSSQLTYDVIQQSYGVDSCERNQQVLSQLMLAISQLQKTVSRLESHVTGTGQNKGDESTKRNLCYMYVILYNTKCAFSSGSRCHIYLTSRPFLAYHV